MRAFTEVILCWWIEQPCHVASTNNREAENRETLRLALIRMWWLHLNVVQHFLHDESMPSCKPLQKLVSCKIGLAPFNLLWQCLLVPTPWPIKTANEYNHHLCTGFWEYILFFSPGRFMVRQDGFFASITAEVAFEDLDICFTPMILSHFFKRHSTSTLLWDCSTEKLWNSFISVALSICLPSFLNLQYLCQSSDAWMKCRWTLQNKISVSGAGLLSRFLFPVLCGKVKDLSRVVWNENPSWWKPVKICVINHITAGWHNWWWFLRFR